MHDILTKRKQLNKVYYEFTFRRKPFLFGEIQNEAYKKV